MIELGPVLNWPVNQGPSPTCKGSCNRQGWSLNHETGYWSCSCDKPSQRYLFFCELCELVYLAPPDATYDDERFPRERYHDKCRSDYL